MRTGAKKRMMGFVLLGVFFFASVSYAKSTREIDASVDTAIERFQKEVFAGN